MTTVCIPLTYRECAGGFRENYVLSNHVGLLFNRDDTCVWGGVARTLDHVRYIIMHLQIGRDRNAGRVSASLRLVNAETSCSVCDHRYA